MIRVVACVERRHFLLSALDRCVGVQPPNNREKTHSALKNIRSVARNLKRLSHKHFALPKSGKTRRNSDNCVSDTGQSDPTSKHIRIRSKPFAPQMLADDNDGTCFLFLRIKEATDHRRDADRAQEI